MAPHCIIIKSPDTVVQVVFWQEKTVNSKVKVGGALRGRKVGGRRWRDCREKSFLYCWSQQQTHILNTDPYCVRFSPHPSLFWTTGGGGRLCFQEEMRETPEAELQGLTDLFTSMTHEKSKSARSMLSCVCAPVCLHVFMTKRSFFFFFWRQSEGCSEVRLWFTTEKSPISSLLVPSFFPFSSVLLNTELKMLTLLPLYH